MFVVENIFPSRIRFSLLESYSLLLLLTSYFICFILDFSFLYICRPITVAMRSQAWTVFSRSNTGDVNSNPTRGMNVCICVYSEFMLPSVQVAAFRQADPPSKELYRLCKKVKKLKKRPGSNKGLQSHREWKEEKIYLRVQCQPVTGSFMLKVLN
jgi:hypothetical protein